MKVRLFWANICRSCDVNSRATQFQALHRHARPTTAPKVRSPLFPRLYPPRSLIPMRRIYPLSANNASEHSNRRTQTNAGGTSTNAAASRAYHNSHAYAVSQQPLFTSWNLPDYLAHLEAMLPTDIPRPLEVRGSVLDATGRDSQERTTERGVKVKWPSKRMSVGDMNKRVRSLVEWVGREQAAALERTRRKEALEKALQAQERAASTGEGGLMDIDTHTGEPPVHGHDLSHPEPTALPIMVDGGAEDSTMSMMEEIMEELIEFQERFGPGAKVKERDRRAGTL